MNDDSYGPSAVVSDPASDLINSVRDTFEEATGHARIALERYDMYETIAVIQRDGRERFSTKEFCLDTLDSLHQQLELRLAVALYDVFAPCVNTDHEKSLEKRFKESLRHGIFIHDSSKGEEWLGASGSSTQALEKIRSKVLPQMLRLVSAIEAATTIEHGKAPTEKPALFKSPMPALR